MSPPLSSPLASSCSPRFHNADELKRMTARFAPVPLRVDTSKLSKDDMRALPKLIEAARVVDHLFLQQLWSGNLKLYADLQKDTSALGKRDLSISG